MIVTFAHMNLLMDADCLIKLAKSGLKEAVCKAWSVAIPRLVRRETVEQASHLPDAVLIGRNIEAGRIVVKAEPGRHAKGEDAVLQLFEAGGFDAVATDDARFIRRLRVLGIPYAVPGVIVVRMVHAGHMTLDQAMHALGSLKGYISAEQQAAAQLMLTGGVQP